MNNKKFNGSRLSTARKYRGLGITDLSRLVGISKQSLSLYEKNENIPHYENVALLANALKFPYEFFVTEDKCETITSNTYFRSQASVTKKQRLAQTIKLEYIAKIYEIFLDYVDFPQVNLPNINFESGNKTDEYDSNMVAEEIERISSTVREYWKLGKEPIENLQYILEKNGIIVTGFEEVSNKIDAFSQRILGSDSIYRYIIAVALGTKPETRLRFDMAHELGHILLHKWEEKTDDLQKDEFNGIEKQANMFASAFLLPRDSFGKEISLYPTDLSYYSYLKKKWKVSMQAMMYRTYQLEIITTNQFQYLMRRVSKNGWRNHEPGDKPGTINNTIFQGAIDILFENGYLDAKTLMQDFREKGIVMWPNEIENLLHLKEGSLEIQDNVVPIIKLKSKLNRDEE